MDKYQVVIVIPAFNEETTIYNVVQSVKEYGVVIVVNDASTDNTEGEAHKAGAIVINHKNNKGYDSALNSGFIQAEKLRCDMVITFDADGQHNADLLEKYIQLIENGSDVVIGIRDKFQRVGEYIFSKISKAKWGIADPLCGMKAYRIDVYRKLGHFDSYNSIGTELSIFAVECGMEVKQLAIPTNKRIDMPRFGNRIIANFKILKSIYLVFFNRCKKK
jgi:glycosyltransferase involved in cell wall biosynthesis